MDRTHREAGYYKDFVYSPYSPPRTPGGGFLILTELCLLDSEHMTTQDDSQYFLFHLFQCPIRPIPRIVDIRLIVHG